MNNESAGFYDQQYLKKKWMIMIIGMQGKNLERKRQTETCRNFLSTIRGARRLSHGLSGDAIGHSQVVLTHLFPMHPFSAL